MRLPFYGAPVLPYGVGRYQRGRYDSLGGPLYVNVGIGTYIFPVRFNCRPEITVVQNIDPTVYFFDSRGQSATLRTPAAFAADLNQESQPARWN